MSGRSRRNTLIRRAALLAGLLAAGAWAYTGFYSIAPSEHGVVLRFGRVVADNVPPGMHYTWPAPIGRVLKSRLTEVRRIEVGYTMLGRKFTEARRSDLITGDENILKMMLVVQYRVATPPTAFLLRAEDPHWLVERAMEASLSRSVASLPVDAVLTTARSELQIRALEDAQALLDSYGAGVTLIDANLQEVMPPLPVGDAFTDVASAKKDAEQRVEQAREAAARTLANGRSEAQRLTEEARGKRAERVSKAEGDAERFVRLLPEYRRAPELTRTRLYLEAMERILSRAKIYVIEPGEGETRPRITVLEDR